jgi:hypothetical protein
MQLAWMLEHCAQPGLVQHPLQPAPQSRNARTVPERQRGGQGCAHPAAPETSQAAFVVGRGVRRRRMRGTADRSKPLWEALSAGDAVRQSAPPDSCKAGQAGMRGARVYWASGGAHEVSESRFFGPALRTDYRADGGVAHSVRGVRVGGPSPRGSRPRNRWLSRGAVFQLQHGTRAFGGSTGSSQGATAVHRSVATAALVACMERDLYGVAILAEASEPSFEWKDAA